MGIDGEGGLFSIFILQSHKSLPLRAKDWFRTHSSTFFMALSSSIALHILIFLLLIASNFTSLTSSREGPSRSTDGTFYQELLEIEDMVPDTFDKKALAGLIDVKITGSLDEKDKALLTQKLNEALID